MKAHTFPIAMPTQPRMNMLRKTCQPATQPLRSSPAIPLKRIDCHSACVYASERRKILVETKALIAHHAEKKVYQIPARP